MLIQRLLVSLAKIPLATAIALLVAAPAAGDEPASFEVLSAEYASDVRPLVEQFCLDCHATDEQEGDLDLEQFATLAEVRAGTKAWLKAREMLADGEMPPEEADQPAPADRQLLLDWIERYLHAEALAGAGDPGPVVLRRLNNAEYTYTIRDLTKVELDPARQFPSEGAGGEGFTNVGNALAMSPALLSKYLDAGKQIAAHAVLLPDGFRFSLHTTRRDRTDEILAEIRGMYGGFTDTVRLGVGTDVGNLNVHGDTRLGLAGRLPLQKYLAATLDEREAIESGAKTIAVVAAERELSAKYLGTLWANLTATEPSFLRDRLRSRWRAAQPKDAAALAAEVAGWQKGLWTFGPVGLIGRKGGRSRWMEPVNPLVSQVELRYAIPPVDEGQEGTETVLDLVVTDAGDANEHDVVLFHQPRLVAEGMPDILIKDLLQPDAPAGEPAEPTAEAEETPTTAEVVEAAWHHTPPVALRTAMFGKHSDGGEIDAGSLSVRAPAVIQIRLPAEAAAGREFVTTASLDPATGAEGSVQVLEVVHGIHGAPSIRSGLFTSEVSVKFSQVISLFSDDEDVTFRGAILVGEASAARGRIEAAMDAYRDLFPAALCYTQIVPTDEVVTVQLFYREDDHLARLMLDDAQRSRLDRLWNELRYVSRSPLTGLETLELQLEVLIDSPQLGSIVVLREPYRRTAAAFRLELIESEPRHLAALIDFATRAYRGRMTGEEADALLGLYRRLREQEMSHEEAFRLTLARVLVASPFLYRLENLSEGSESAPVSDWELANRLSYFLWSSLPDEELRAAAERGHLTSNSLAEAELLRQTDRMLKHPLIRRLAIEFACQYLHIHGFDPLMEKSEEHFPEFAALRGDMYEEAILFFTYFFSNDSSLLDLLDADHTYVNERLATFYGIEGMDVTGWMYIDKARRFGRGGILAMAATLAQQSGATRTSPILRGNWVSEVLLGEKLPRPPQNVPQLSATVPEGLTERQLIEQHSSDAACAKCHQRIDPFGFALENYDAIGRRRELSAGGQLIDSRTTLPDGTEIEGLAGLRDYLVENRRAQFVRQFCRKLLGYALGREVQLSDQPLLDEMMERLAENDYRFSVALELIVLSDQFRKKRG